MAEKEVKKVAKKKTPVKKVDKKEDVQNNQDVQETPKRRKRVEIARNELIPCRSATVGELIYISDRTRAKYIWEDFGSTLYLEMGELQDMNGSKRAFLHEGYLVVEDEDAADNLGLTKLYKELSHIDSLEELFSKNADELELILPRLPKGMVGSIASKARELVESGELESLSKIRVIEKCLGFDLQDFIKK